MQLNDVLAMLMEVPPMLASQWAAWFAVGLILSIWGRHEKTRVAVHASSRHQSGVRSAPAVRPPVFARTQAAAASSGDAFAELEALLEQPTGLHRTPGESPLDEEEAAAAKLSAPQSLP